MKWLEKDKWIFKTNIEYLVLALATIYFLAVIKSVSPRKALSEGFTYLMYFAVFMLLSEFTSNKSHRDLVLKIFISSYLLVCIIGIDGALDGNMVSALNSLFKKLNLNYILNGLIVENRIGSIIQYPNALAACLCAMIFIVISLYLRTNRFYGKLIYTTFAFVFLLTLCLTVSRGIFVIIPIAVIVYILLLPKAKRLEALLLMSVLAAAIIPVFLKVYGQITKDDSTNMKSWLYIILGVAIVSILSLIIKPVVRKLSTISLKVYLFTLCGLIICAVIISVFVFISAVPLVIKTTDDGQVVSERKRVVLKSDNSYRLEFRVEASSIDNENPVYYVQIANKNKSEVVQSRETIMTELSGASTDGAVTKSLTFSVPKDSKMLNIRFGSKASNAKAIFYSANIYDASTNKLVKKMILQYKYIPQSIATRFEAFKAADTGLSRLVYYKDAVSIIKDHGVIGAGGGAWSDLYTAYQSMFYSTNDPHSYLFKLAVEAGVVGVGIFLLILSVTVYNIYKRRRSKAYETVEDIIVEVGVVTAIVAIVLHSCIDLDFSIPSVFLIFWMLMSILNAHTRNLKEKNEADNNISKPKGLKNMVKSGMYQPAIIIVIGIVAISFSTMFLASQNYLRQSQKVTGDNANEKKIAYHKKAISTDPYSSTNRIEYANILVRNNGDSRDVLYEAYNQIAKAEKLSYYNTKCMAQIAAFYLAVGDAGRGLSAIDRSTALSPLWVDSWYQKVDAYKNVTLVLFQKGQTENAIKMLDKTLNVINEIKAINSKADSPMMPDKDLSLVLERMKYVKEYINVDKSINMDRIVFNSFNSMDVDSDGRPDQWKSSSDFDLTYNRADDAISISGTKGKASLVSKRAITFEAGKHYKVKLELAPAGSEKNIAIKVEGMSEDALVMVKEGENYALDLEVPEDFISNDNTIEIIIDGDCKIKKLLIIKE